MTAIKFQPFSVRLPSPTGPLPTMHLHFRHGLGEQSAGACFVYAEAGEKPPGSHSGFSGINGVSGSVIP